MASGWQVTARGAARAAGRGGARVAEAGASAARRAGSGIASAFLAGEGAVAARRAADARSLLEGAGVIDPSAAGLRLLVPASALTAAQQRAVGQLAAASVERRLATMAGLGAAALAVLVTVGVLYLLLRPRRAEGEEVQARRAG